MKKILMAVLAAFLTMGVVSAQADDSAAPKRRSLREMKAGVHQHKAERVKIVQKKREEMKAANEQRQAAAATRAQAYAEEQAALAEEESAKAGEELEEETATTTTTGPVNEDADKSIEELQAEIEQSLHELRENVDNFQDQVQQEVGDAIANPPSSDSSSSNE